MRAQVNFPGIVAPISGSYTMGHGTDPGKVIIQCNPQDSKVFQDGPVVFSFDGIQNKIPDCRIISDNVSLNSEGFVTRVELEDFRWKWRFPTIDGEYNVRNAYQSVYRPSQKNPQELASLLIEALGIPKGRYSVAGLPTDDYPYVQWYAANVADELSALAERYGCRVVPYPDGRLFIFKLGEGSELPTQLSKSSDSKGVVAPAGPDKIDVHFGPTAYRVICLLEPVGIDVDGSVKDIDLLSYRPSGGWGRDNGTQHEDPGSFWKLQNYLVSKYGASESRRGKFAFILDLARRAIFRWYRITLVMPDGSELKIPGYKKEIKDIGQLLPIDDRVANVSLDPENPAKILDGSNPTDLFWDVYDQTQVWGTFLKKSTHGLSPVFPDYNAAKKPIGNNFYPPGGYSIDRERGIVMFDDYVTSLKDNGDGTRGSLEFPSLFLSFMCRPREYKTRKMQRYVVSRDRTDIIKAGTKPQVLVHPEFQMVVTFDIESDGKPGPAREVNKKLLDKVGNYYIDAQLRKYRKQNPRSINYNGLAPIYPNGAIREVSYIVTGESGFDTQASYNDERQPYVIPYETRRRNQRVAANLATDSFVPPVFNIQPQTFPFNMSSAFISASPSRR